MTADKKNKETARDINEEGAKAAEAFVTFGKEMYKKQLEIFGQWNDMLKKNIPDPEESKVLTNIVMDHWKKMSGRIEELTPELVTPGPHIVDNQKKLVLEFIGSYNNMLKEIMATSQFASMVGAQMTRAMEQRGEMERFRDEMASNMGIPTRTDIRDLHESIYFLNKRFDDLERLVRKVLEDKKDGGKGGRK